MFLCIIKFNKDDKDNNDDNDKNSKSILYDDNYHVIRMKIQICSLMQRMLRTLREQSEMILALKGFSPDKKIPRGLLIKGTKAIKSAYDKFLIVKSIDLVNEKHPKLLYLEKEISLEEV